MQTLEEFLKDKTLPVTVDFEGSGIWYPVTIYFREEIGNFIGKDIKGNLKVCVRKNVQDWFITEPPKPKVKRAQYIVKIPSPTGIPFETREFFKDEKEVSEYYRNVESIERLTETEREFDE